MGIGNRLRRLRTERGFTQKELAAKVTGGLDYTYIGKIEREEQLPSLKILMKLSEALVVPLSSFFCDEDEQYSPASPLRLGKVINLANAREMSILYREINQLQRNDIPLLVEIVRALNKHRKTEKGGDFPTSVKEYSLVAEEEHDYDDE